MNKIILIVIIVIILVVAIAGYFIYAGGKSPVYNTNTQNPNTVNQQQNQTGSVTGAISIQNFSFNPSPLTVKVGTTVTWTNNDPMTHQIKSSTFNSSPLTSGQTFQFTFNNLGTYDYSCAIHPSMKGQIIVTQ